MARPPGASLLRTVAGCCPAPGRRRGLPGEMRKGWWGRRGGRRTGAPVRSTSHHLVAAEAPPGPALAHPCRRPWTSALTSNGKSYQASRAGRCVSAAAEKGLLKNAHVSPRKAQSAERCLLWGGRGPRGLETLRSRKCFTRNSALQDRAVLTCITALCRVLPG